MTGDYIPKESWPSNAGRLRFDTQDDALNFARQCAEDGRRWARERGFSVEKDYLKNRNCIDLTLHSRSRPHKLKLIMEFVPSVENTRPQIGMGDKGVAGGPKLQPGVVQRHADNALVFVGASDTAQRVEQIVPSMMRLNERIASRFKAGDAYFSPID
jgi:hypothetical protein